jgi:hypothetical protein
VAQDDSADAPDDHDYGLAGVKIPVTEPCCKITGSCSTVPFVIGGVQLIAQVGMSVQEEALLPSSATSYFSWA